jgi:hypothetical protein
MPKLRGFQRGQERAQLHCSFCGKSQHEVRKLIGGSDRSGALICSECVADAVEIIVVAISL